VTINACKFIAITCREVSQRLGLVEGRDYEHVCLGENGFQPIIKALAGENETYGPCDIGISSITATSERESRGITFSHATYHGSLVILVHAPLKHRGTWAFFDPLHWTVWIGLALTVIITPMIVFFLEAVFNKRCVTCQFALCVLVGTLHP